MFAVTFVTWCVSIVAQALCNILNRFAVTRLDGGGDTVTKVKAKSTIILLTVVDLKTRGIELLISY